MLNTLLNRIYTAIFSIIATSVVVILIVVALQYHAKESQRKFADELLTLVGEIAGETSANLVKLNQIATMQCDETLMRKMRQLLFQSRYTKEIGFYQNGYQLCNTSLGVLGQPLRATVPDLVAKSSHEVWVYRPSDLFDRKYLTFVIKDENFHVVLDPLEIISHSKPDFLWQWVYHDERQTMPLFGVNGLFVENSSRSASIGEVSGVVCSSNVTYCIATRKDLISGLTAHDIGIYALFVSCLLVCFYLLGMFVVRYWYSPELRIKRGISQHCFYPVFQPIVELASGRIVGCEVLARFRDKLGNMGPEHFIQTVSNMHKTIPFTRSILTSATIALVQQAQLPKGFRVNFNLFPNDLTEANFAHLARYNSLFENRFDICFEITEDEPFNNAEAKSVLNKLKALGSNIAIDDFGTGYSNFDQLQSIEFDYLKIDKSFCLGLELSTFRAGLIPQIVKIAELLGVPVVAEGVETERQRRTLVKESVLYGQGYLFGKPMTAAQLGDLVFAQVQL